MRAVIPSYIDSRKQPIGYSNTYIYIYQDNNHHVEDIRIRISVHEEVDYLEVHVPTCQY